MDLARRLQRLYAALGEALDRGWEKLQPTVQNEPPTMTEPGRMTISFGGGLSRAQLENIAGQQIFHVAHLRDHLRKWARVHSCDPDLVNQAIERSLALKVIIDLADADKHGADRRDPGLSGKHPRLEDLTRCLRFTGGSEEPAITVEVFAGPPRTTDVQGDVAAIVTARVVDRENVFIGDLDDLLAEAVGVFEKLMESWGGLRVDQIREAAPSDPR